MMEFFCCLTLQKNKEPEDSLRSSRFDSNIFGSGSREGKKKKKDIHLIRGSVNQRETERQTQVTHRCVYVKIRPASL